VNKKIMDIDSDFKNFKNPSTTHENYVHMVEKIYVQVGKCPPM